jgi:hypothetical protein
MVNLLLFFGCLSRSFRVRFSKSWKPALLLLLRIVAARSSTSLAGVAAMGFLQ